MPRNRWITTSPASPWLLVMAGFIAAALCDVGCPRHAESMTLAQQGRDFVMAFAAHPDNATLEVFVDCPGDPVFRSGQVWDLDPTLTSARVRIPDLPVGRHCTAAASVMRNPTHDHDREHSTMAEWTLLLINT